VTLAACVAYVVACVVAFRAWPAWAGAILGAATLGALILVSVWLIGGDAWRWWRRQRRRRHTLRY